MTQKSAIDEVLTFQQQKAFLSIAFIQDMNATRDIYIIYKEAAVWLFRRYLPGLLELFIKVYMWKSNLDRYSREEMRIVRLCDR